MMNKKAKTVTDITEDWKLYTSGIGYNNQITPSYYETLDQNERMEAGEQWKGVNSKGLPTPVANKIKPIVNYLTAALTSEELKAIVSTDILNAEATDYDEEAQELAEVLTSYLARSVEKNKLDDMMKDVVHEGAISGDIVFTHTLIQQ